MRALVIAAACAVAALGACSDPPKLTVEQLQDPNTCKDCHALHYEQWEGSMHAYAADDPVFLAMNKRGQRETNGALGDFCITCHAPMAKQLGFTDFANFDPAALPPAARGITCYFCHNVQEVTGTHNNGLVLANDQTMRGGVKDPVGTEAHNSKYDVLMASAENRSEMCGSCHDIVVPAHINLNNIEVPIERTFAEWRATFFNSPDDPLRNLTCSGCHMPTTRDDLIADAPGVKPRESAFHDHKMPGIDLALTPWPQMAAQRTAVQDILDASARIIGPPSPGSSRPTGGICVVPDSSGNVLSVRVDSISVGHSWPSGAAQDRRAWLEVTAYGDNDVVLYTTGTVPAGQDPEAVVPNSLVFYDRTLKANGQPSHFFWDVATTDSKLLPAASFPGEDVSRSLVVRLDPLGISPASIKKVEAQFKFNPLPFALIDDLIASGDLSPEIRGRVQTLSVGAKTVWEKGSEVLGCGPKRN